MERKNRGRMVHFSVVAKSGVPTQIEVNNRIATRRFLAESCELAKALPPRKKCLFLMRFDMGFSNKEIAALCKVSEGTVARRI